MFRTGLRALLEPNPTIEVIGEAANGRQAAESADKLSPDVIVMDIAMPEMNGILATRRITARNPCPKIIALTMHSDGQYVSKMFAAGASAYLLKGCDVNELIRAIELVHAGGKYLTPSITGEFIADYKRGVSKFPEDSETPLSRRQQEVLQLLAEGLASKEIGARLHISVKTVTAHRQNIMNTLGIRSVAELTKYAVRAGLTSLDA